MFNDNGHPLSFNQYESVFLMDQSGLMDDGVKVGLLGAWMALFVIFAARKFTQPIKVNFT